jgi:hypothetical protein
MEYDVQDIEIALANAQDVVLSDLGDGVQPLGRGERGDVGPIWGHDRVDLLVSEETPI